MDRHTRHPSAARRPPQLRTIPLQPPTTRQLAQPGAPFARELTHLAALVGGFDRLDGLDDTPVRSPWLDATGIAGEHPPRVELIRREIDAGLGPLVEKPTGRADWDCLDPPTIDDEHLAIAHRILAGLARSSPALVLGPSPKRAAAAVAWLTIIGNRRPALRPMRRPTAATVWTAFDVASAGDVSRRLRSALPVARFDPAWEWLVEPGLLHSRHRASVISDREHYRGLTLDTSDETGRRDARHLRIVR